MNFDPNGKRVLIDLKEHIVSHFSHENWHELGILTGSSELIENHARLLRSLSWGDEDYPGHVLAVLQSIFKSDEENVDIVIKYVTEKFPPEGINISSESIGKPAILFSPQVFEVPDVSVELRLVSVMMPFNASTVNAYASIKRAVEANECRCERADDIWEHSVLIQDIFSLIFRSNIVVCDFSGKNPNVFYEAGIAHTLGKHVIPITQSASDIPFDLQHHRYIPYLNNSEGLAELERKLGDRIKTLVDKS